MYKFKRGLPFEAEDWIRGTDISNLDTKDFKKLLMVAASHEWKDRWSNSPSGRTTFAFIPEADFDMRNPDFGFSLRCGFVLTEHGSISDFLKRRHLSASEQYVCGEAVEDAEHILCECPCYAHIRNLSGMRIYRRNRTWILTEVLKAEESKTCYTNLQKQLSAEEKP